MESFSTVRRTPLDWEKKAGVQPLGIEPRFSGPQPEVLTTIRRLPML